MSHQMLENGLKKEMNNCNMLDFNCVNRLQKAVISYLNLYWIIFDKLCYSIGNYTADK